MRAGGGVKEGVGSHLPLVDSVFEPFLPPNVPHCVAFLVAALVDLVPLEVLREELDGVGGEGRACAAQGRLVVVVEASDVRVVHAQHLRETGRRGGEREEDGCEGGVKKSWLEY